MKWNWQPATNKPVLLVMGPTGVGKTEWVLHFLTSFFHHQIEIINADSMQVYRGMDIGTAKPSADQRSRVPHHLMDCCLPNEPFTAGAFVEAADALLEPILNRRHLPVLCGGTGYYFKNFLMGLPAVPKTDLSLLLRLTADIQRSPGDRQRLFAQLQSVDPVSAARIHPNDTYRLARALEVYHTHAVPLSAYAVPSLPRSGLQACLLGLTRPRSELTERIERRVDAMLAAGLREEVLRLSLDGYGAADFAMKGIGYREFLEFVGEEAKRWESPALLPTVRAAMIRRSKAYAKKQMTYFNGIKGISWFHPEDSEGITRYLSAWVDRWNLPISPTEPSAEPPRW